MLKAVYSRSEGFCARFALGALAWLPVMLGGCSSTVGEEAAYVSAYQPYRDICVISKGEHSPVFDITLMRTLRDRGFNPEFIERGQPAAAKRCRIIVTFTSGTVNIPLEAPADMALGFVDTYTGESYHVSASRRKPAEPKSLFFGRPQADPSVMIRHLVDRLFPERE